MSHSAFAATGEGRFLRAEQGIASTAAEHRRPRELRPAAAEANFGWICPLLLMYIRPENQCQERVHMQKDSWS